MRIGGVVFADDARNDFYLSSFRNTAELDGRLSTLGRYYPNSITNTASALERMRVDQFRTDAGDRPQVREKDE